MNKFELIGKSDIDDLRPLSEDYTQEVANQTKNY
jgi:hypothetical protein